MIDSSKTILLFFFDKVSKNILIQSTTPSVQQIFARFGIQKFSRNKWTLSRTATGSRAQCTCRACEPALDEDQKPIKKMKTDEKLQAMLSCPLILVIHCTYWSGRVDYQMDRAIAS